MNFRKLPKEKRNHLILVILVTLIAGIGLYFGLIRHQHDNLDRLAGKKDAAKKKLQTVQDAIRRADQIKGELEVAKSALTAAEADIATGDLYAWVINSLRQFKASYNVDIPQYSPLGAPTEVSLIPNFPYKQATLTIAGTAHFHDLGRFLADFENRFPHVRLLNLTLDANAPSISSEPEMLAFKLDIITLVKPNAS
jgi:Tfp pilus assembly protein PilO